MQSVESDILCTFPSRRKSTISTRKQKKMGMAVDDFVPIWGKTQIMLAKGTWRLAQEREAYIQKCANLGCVIDEDEGQENYIRNRFIERGKVIPNIDEGEWRY